MTPARIWMCPCGCGQVTPRAGQLAPVHPRPGVVTCAKNGCPLALGHDKAASRFTDFPGQRGPACIPGNETDWRET